MDCLYPFKVKKSKSKPGYFCKAPLNTNTLSIPLRYGNTQFCLQTSHTCLYCPATEHHCHLADTHIDVYTMDGAPPIGQRLGVEAECRPTDDGQGRDGLIFDAHHRRLFTFLN